MDLYVKDAITEGKCVGFIQFYFSLYGIYQALNNYFFFSSSFFFTSIYLHDLYIYMSMRLTNTATK